MAAVEIAGVVRRFGPRVAVDGVGLQVAQGEFLALLGPSGCGSIRCLRRGRRSATASTWTAAVR